MHKTKVRWPDGFERSYKTTELQFGSDYVWVKLTDGKEKWIPSRNIRHVTTLKMGD